MSLTLHTDLGDLKLEIFCEQVPKASEVSVKSTFFDYEIWLAN